MALDAAEGMVPSLYLHLAESQVPAMPGFLLSAATSIQARIASKTFHGLA